MARWLARAFWLLALGLAASAVSAQETAPFRVRYRSAETVYLDAGRAVGIEVGDRLEVLAGGEPVAALEVVYAAQHSASCRVVEGDAGAVAVGAAVRPAPGSAGERPASEAAEGETAGEAPAAEAPRTEGPAAEPRPGYRSRRPANRLGGSVALDYDQFTDGSGAGYDWQRQAARLDLRVDDIAGTGHDLRVRLRLREDERERPLTAGPSPGGVPESESRDRLYELALIYEPGEKRYGYRVGRLLAGPYAGVGYLDGAMGRFSVSPRFDVGAFAGARPDVSDLGFESGGNKAGLFVRWSPAAGDGVRGRFAQGGEPFEVFVAGVREQADDTAGLDAAREYVTLETRWVPGSRWAFYQRAELDLEPPPVGAGAGESGRLSQLSLSAVGTLSPSARVRIVYHRTEPFLFEEEVDPDLPEERFADLLRQGLRAGMDFGRPGGATVGFDAGVREDESDRDPTTSVRLFAFHPRAFGGDWSLSASALGFTGEIADGVLLDGRVARRFGRGHELSFAAGGSGHRETAFEDEELAAYWARAGVWIELPANLFSRAEFEAAGGDGREGQRLSTSLGWRF